MRNRILSLIFVVLLLIAVALPGMAAQVKETDILVYNTSTSKWTRMTKGDFLAAVARGATVTQTTTTGAGFTVSRDKALANSDSPLCYILNDNAGDDQPAVKIKQDGAGDILQLFGSGAAQLFGVSDLGAITATAAETAGVGFTFQRDLVAGSSDNAVFYILDDSATDDQPALKIKQDGSGNIITGIGAAAATVFELSKDGNVAVGGTLGVTGAATIPVLGTVAIDASAGNVILTAATHGGKVLIVTGTGAAQLTLPANNTTAGTWIRIVNVGTDGTEPIYKAAVADTLVVPNDAEADSVTFGSGHRMGSSVLFIATGAKWICINESTACTMTPTS